MAQCWNIISSHSVTAPWAASVLSVTVYIMIGLSFISLAWIFLWDLIIQLPACLSTELSQSFLHEMHQRLNWYFCLPGSTPNLFPVTACGTAIHPLGQARNRSHPWCHLPPKPSDPICHSVLWTFLLRASSDSIHFVPSPQLPFKTMQPPTFTRTTAATYLQLS